MKLNLIITGIFLLSLVANTLGLIFAWILGFIGVVVFNIILVLIPGIYITYKASINWQNLKTLWSVSFGIIPVIFGLIYFFYNENNLAIASTFIGVIIIFSCSFTIKAALNE